MKLLFRKKLLICVLIITLLCIQSAFQSAHAESIWEGIGRLNTDLKKAFGGGTVGEVAKDEIILPLGGLALGATFYGMGVMLGATEAEAGEDPEEDIDQFKQIGDIFYQGFLIPVCVLDLYLTATFMVNDMDTEGWIMLTKSAVADFFLFKEAGPIFDDGKKESEAILITGGIILAHSVSTYVIGEKLRKLEKSRRGEINKENTINLVIKPIPKGVKVTLVKSF